MKDYLECSEEIKHFPVVNLMSNHHPTVPDPGENLIDPTDANCLAIKLCGQGKPRLEILAPVYASYPLVFLKLLVLRHEPVEVGYDEVRYLKFGR